jgi:hypothetical protein
MLDTVLDWSVVALPTVAGIAGWLMPVTERKRKYRYWFAIVGVVLSGLIYLQQHRARVARANETQALTERIGEVQRETEKLRHEQQAEIARRQQAERDLAIIIQGVGQSTRSGIAEDIRRSPITVNVESGASARIAEERQKVQAQVANLMNEGKTLRDAWEARLRKPNGGQGQIASEVQRWHERTAEYLKTIPRGNVYLARFQTSPRPSGAYPVGIEVRLAGIWDILLGNLSRLNEFMTDPDLGRP